MLEVKSFYFMVSAGFVFFDCHLLDILVLIIIGIGWFYTQNLNPNRLFVPKHDPRCSYPHYDSGIKERDNLLICISVPYVFYLIIYFIGKYSSTSIIFPFDLIQVLVGHIGSIFISNLLANCIKIQVGRPRPDFFAMLGDDFGAEDQQPSCLSRKAFNEQFKSFPSGHSTTAASGCLFFSIFLAKSIKTNQMSIFMLKSIPIIYMFYIGCTRITEHRHHFEDVLCGFLIGIIFPPLYFYGMHSIFRDNFFP